MVVLIIGGMEGVSGIVRWGQTIGGAALYEGGRRLYTEEINAAIEEGAARALADRSAVTRRIRSLP